MSPPTIADVLARLAEAGMVVDHQPGENGVATMCPLCPGWTIWTEDLQRFVCSRRECPGDEAPSLVANEIHQRGESRRGGYGRGAEASMNGATDAESTFDLLGFDDLLALPDPEWLIDGLVPAEGLSVIFGAPGSFKSFVALDWALCVATGLPWFGREVKPGWIVYVAAEGRGGLKQRVRAWWQERGRPDMSRARFLPEAVNLLDRAQVERARRTLDSLPERARLLTVDTMARSMVSGDENAARDVGMFIAAVDGLRRSDAAHVVHHAGKDGKDERGSSTLRGAADVMVKTEREGRSPRLRLICDKAKDFDQWESLNLQREIVGDSCVLSFVADRDAVAEIRERVRADVLAFVRTNAPASKRGSRGRDRQARIHRRGAQQPSKRRLDRDHVEGIRTVPRPRGHAGAHPCAATPAGPCPGEGDMDVVHPSEGTPLEPCPVPRALDGEARPSEPINATFDVDPEHDR